MSGVKVANYKGVNIFYDSQHKNFSSTVQDLEVEAVNQADLEKKIDDILKKSGLFPIKVIYVSAHYIKYGRITSYSPSDKRGYFVSENGQREKPWRLDEFYLDTESNRATVKEIENKIAQAQELDKGIEVLTKQLRIPFPEYFAEVSNQAENKG